MRLLVPPSAYIGCHVRRRGPMPVMLKLEGCFLHSNRWRTTPQTSLGALKPCACWAAWTLLGAHLHFLHSRATVPPGAQCPQRVKAQSGLLPPRGASEADGRQISSKLLSLMENRRRTPGSSRDDRPRLGATLLPGSLDRVLTHET